MNTLKVEGGRSRVIGSVDLGMPEHEADYHRRIRRFEALHGGLVRDRSYSHLIETEAYNAVESYRLAADGTIETVFRFNQGGSDGPAKVYTPRGLVQERQSNAVWGMQFIWPIKAEYRIIYLAPDYSQTVIGRTRRDDVWIMARQPSIPAEDYARIPIDELRARMDELPRKRATSGLTASWVSAPTTRPGRCCSTGSGSGASAAATRRKGK